MIEAVPAYRRNRSFLEKKELDGDIPKLAFLTYSIDNTTIGYLT